MAGLGDYKRLSERDLRSEFEKAQEAGADFLAVHGYSWMSVGTVFGGNSLDMVNIGQKAQPVRKDHIFEDLLKADVGEGLLNIEAVFDLSEVFRPKSFSEGRESVAILGDDAEKARIEFEKRYYWREYDALHWSVKLTKAKPPKPDFLK